MTTSDIGLTTSLRHLETEFICDQRNHDKRTVKVAKRLNYRMATEQCRQLGGELTFPTDADNVTTNDLVIGSETCSQYFWAPFVQVSCFED